MTHVHMRGGGKVRFSKDYMSRTQSSCVLTLVPLFYEVQYLFISSMAPQAERVHK